MIVCPEHGLGDGKCCDELFTCPRHIAPGWDEEPCGCETFPDPTGESRKLGEMTVALRDSFRKIFKERDS